jgi:phage terminase large subunit-like protein
VAVLEESPLERLAALPRDERAALIRDEARQHGLDERDLKALLLRSWRFVGRPKQQPPPEPWTFWWIKAGRGFGKTITCAEWAKECALSERIRFALVAPTLGDVRKTMYEGETGLLSVVPNQALLGQSRSIAWNRSTMELTLANGTQFFPYSSEEPNRLRGPQHHKAWLEEVSSWADADRGDAVDSTWSNVKLATRLGTNPQFALSSTPKTNRLTLELARLADEGRVVMTAGSSYENRANLSDVWWEQVVAPLVGTRTGRQEIEAEILTDVEGALWTRVLLDACRVDEQPRESFEKVVVGLDPNVTSGETADAAGIVVVGRRRDPDGADRAYVLADRTCTHGGPSAWRTAALEAYYDFQADRIVAEVNNGGELVAMVVKALDPGVVVKSITASRGKRTRAEPVSILYERGWETGQHDPRVLHAGAFPELEDEQSTWSGEPDSPNRMDALVWAVTELMLNERRTEPATFHVSQGRIPVPADRFGANRPGNRFSNY